MAILTKKCFVQFIFDVDEGDWAFREIRKNDHVGVEFEIADTPRTSDDWYFTAFNMDMVYGFSIIQAPVVVIESDSIRSFRNRLIFHEFSNPRSFRAKDR